MGLTTSIEPESTAQILVKAIAEYQIEAGKVEAELRFRAILAEQRVAKLEQELEALKASNGE